MGGTFHSCWVLDVLIGLDEKDSSPFVFENEISKQFWAGNEGSTLQTMKAMLTNTLLRNMEIFCRLFSCQCRFTSPSTSKDFLKSLEDITWLWTDIHWCSMDNKAVLKRTSPALSMNSRVLQEHDPKNHAIHDFSFPGNDRRSISVLQVKYSYLVLWFPGQQPNMSSEIRHRRHNPSMWQVLGR